MGVQTRMRRRSVEARLARKVLVGDLKDLLCITVRMINTLPSTPRAKVNLGEMCFSRVSNAGPV